VPTFADRGYHVISVTDSSGHILAFEKRSYVTSKIISTMGGLKAASERDAVKPLIHHMQQVAW
jgi:hypothetical protein